MQAPPRHGVNAPLLIVPFTVLVDIGHPRAVEAPFHVHVKTTGRGLAAKQVGQNIRFPHKSAHQVTTREWLGIFPVHLTHGALELRATIHEGLGHAAGVRPEAHTAQSAITVKGDFSQAPSTTTLPLHEQTSMVESVAHQSVIPFDVAHMLDVVTDATRSARVKLETLKDRRSSISIADMFEMQMLMNHLSQLSEMSTATIAATSTAIASMARNVR